MRFSSFLVVSSAALTLGACAAGDRPATGDTVATDTVSAASAEMAVRIASPADGDSVSLPFTLRLEATGVEVLAVNGLDEPGKGHHHLVIDDEAPSDTLPLAPAPIVIHLGTGATERVIDSLPAGPHRIIAIFAGGTHVPQAGVKRDTITVVVR